MTYKGVAKEKIIELELDHSEREVFDRGVKSVKTAIDGIQM